MNVRTRPHLLVLSALFAVVAVGLIACSGDEPLGPLAPDQQATTPTPLTDDPTYQAILELDGAAELLEQIPAAEKWGRPHGSQLFLAFENTSFTPEPPEFPIDTGIIFYDGFGTPLGHHTAVSPFTINYVTLEQWGTTTYTDASGDELVADWSGTFDLDQATGEVTYNGSLEFVGGTGDYADATGSGGYFGDANVFQGAGRIIWYGWISPGGH